VVLSTLLSSPTAPLFTMDIARY